MEEKHEGVPPNDHSQKDPRPSTQSGGDLERGSGTPEPEIEVIASSDGDGWARDPSNPMNWSLARKYAVVILMGITNIVA